MAMENVNTTMKTDEKKETRSFEERYAEYKGNIAKRFKEAHQKNQAFFQLKPEFIRMPVAGFPGKDGKRHSFQKENAAILMQAAFDKGIEDTRWISLNQLKKEGLYVNKNETATMLVGRDPKTHEPNRMISYFNAQQLAPSSRRKIQEASKVCKKRDTVAKKMAEYLKDNISFKKDADLSDQFAKAYEFGMAEMKKADRQWEGKRIAAIDAVDLKQPADTADIKLMQEAKRLRINQPDNKNYMYAAAVEVLKDGKFNQEQVADALNKVSPEPTGLDFDKGYGKRLVEHAMTHDRELNRNRMLAASR